MIAVLEEIGVLNRCRQYSLRNEDELSSITSMLLDKKSQ